MCAWAARISTPFGQNGRLFLHCLVDAVVCFVDSLAQSVDMFASRSSVGRLFTNTARRVAISASSSIRCRCATSATRPRTTALLRQHSNNSTKFNGSGLASVTRPLSTDTGEALSVRQTLRRGAALTDHDDDHIGLLSRHQVLGWTHAELYKRALGVALALRSLGLEPNDRLLVCVDNNDSEKLLAHLGAPLAGVDVVSVSNPAFLRDAQQVLECKALVISPDNLLHFEDLAELPQSFTHPPILTGPVRLPPNDSGKPPVVDSFIELISEVTTAPLDELEAIASMVLGLSDDGEEDENGNPSPHLYYADAESPTALRLSSVSESDMVNQGRALMAKVQAGAQDRVLVASDLSSPFGAASALGAINCGATVVLTNKIAPPIATTADSDGGGHNIARAPAGVEDVTVLSTLHDSKCTLLLADQESFHNIPLPVPNVHDVSTLRGGLVNGDVDSGLSFVYAGVALETVRLPE